MDYLEMVFLAPGEGGGAGVGGDAGAAAAGPRPDDLEDERSPRDYAERYGYRQPRTKAPEPQEQGTDDASQQAQAQRMSFKDLIRSDEYKTEADEYIQGMLRERFKGQRANEARLQQAEDLLARFAERYKLDATDPRKLDLAALGAKLDEDTTGLEDEALEKGMSVETLANLKALERQNAEYRQREAALRQESEQRAAFAEIARQAAELQKTVPGFDVAAEMRTNPNFARMIMPPSMRGAGLSVEDAYFATHHQEMMTAGMQAAQQRTTQQVVNAIKSGSRPVENGTQSSAAGEAPGVDPARLSSQQLRAIRERARAGEKIGF